MHVTGNTLQHRDTLHFLWGKHLQRSNSCMQTMLHFFHNSLLGSRDPTLGNTGFFRLQSIKVLWRLQYLGYLRTLSLKFQKTRTKIEVVLTLPCWLSQFRWDSQQGWVRTTSILVRDFWNFELKVLKYFRNFSLHNTLIQHLVLCIDQKSNFFLEKVKVFWHKKLSSTLELPKESYSHTDLWKFENFRDIEKSS